MNTGTRSHFADWLYATHKLTYSKYAKLDTAAKLKLQEAYRGKG